MSFDVGDFLSNINTNDLARSNLYYVAFPSLKSLDTAEIFTAEEGSFDKITSDISKTVDNISGAITTLNNITNINNLSDAGSAAASLFGDDQSETVKLSMFAKAVSLPGMALEIDADKQRRYTQHVIRSKSQDNITITFYLSSNHRERQIMMNWFKTIYDSDRNEISFASSYEKKIQVIIFSRDGSPATTVLLDAAFPIRIGPVELGYENNNEISTFEVEFVSRNIKYTNKIEENLELVEADIFDKINSGFDLGKNALNSIKSGLKSLF